METKTILEEAAVGGGRDVLTVVNSLESRSSQQQQQQLRRRQLLSHNNQCDNNQKEGVAVGHLIVEGSSALPGDTVRQTNRAFGAGIDRIRKSFSRDIFRSATEQLSSSFSDDDNIKIKSNSLTTAANVQEIDTENCLHCQNLPVCHAHGSFSLIGYSDTPDYMKGNPFVVQGYRPPQFTTAMCIKSIFKIHNETVNIWSHIIGFFIFLHALINDNLYILPSLDAMLMDHIILTVGIICFMICMLMSACFHIFWCMDEQSLSKWLTLDLMGVTFAILGCYITGIHYAFYCYQTWHNLYMSLLSGIAVITFLAPILPQFASPKFHYHRLTLYVFLGIYGFIPTVHWALKNGGFTTDFTMQFLPSVLGVYGLCGLGVVFYVLMIPERWLPGWFDFIGWSHQWWHILILCGLYMWRSAGIDIIEYRRKTSCVVEYDTFANNATSFLFSE